MGFSSSTLTQLTALADPQPATVAFMNSSWSTINANFAQIFSDLSASLTSTANLVSSVTGTVGQVGASATTGNVVLSLPAPLTLPGALKATDGTALAPSYAFASESSLGLYRSAASVLALSYGTFQANAISASTVTATTLTAGTVNYTTLNPAPVTTTVLGMASNVTNGGTTAKSMFSVGLAANKLAINGQGVRLTMGGNYNAGFGSNYSVQVLFGGTTDQFTALSAAVTENWNYAAVVSRTGATTQKGLSQRLQIGSTNVASLSRFSPSETLSSVVTVEVRTTSHNAADVVSIDYLYLESLST